MAEACTRWIAEEAEIRPAFHRFGADLGDGMEQCAGMPSVQPWYAARLGVGYCVLPQWREAVWDVR